MAKKKTAPALPTGFKEKRIEMAGFFLKEEGNSVQGVLIGDFINNKSKYGAKKVYRIRLTDGTTKVESKDGTDTAESGDVIGIDETGYLKTLSDFGNGEEVYIRCEGKGIAQKGQSPPWVFTVAGRE